MTGVQTCALPISVVSVPLRAGHNHLPPAGDLVLGFVVAGVRGRVRVHVCGRPVGPSFACQLSPVAIPAHLNLARLAFRERTLHVEGEVERGAAAEVHYRRVVDSAAAARLLGHRVPSTFRLDNRLGWYLLASEDSNWLDDVA